MGHLWQKFVSERLRFTSSVAEFTVVTWTIGSRRNASFRRSSTRATTEGRKRNDLLTDPWVQEFRACWQKNHRTDVRRDCIVDLNEVTFIDKCGEQLLCLLAKEGADSTSSWIYTKHIIEHLNFRRK